MKQFFCALFMLLSINALAAEQDGEIQRLYNSLNLLSQQQQAIYQQFQMVQELRSSNFQPPYGTLMLPTPKGEPINYDDVVAAQNNAIRRSEELSEEAMRLLARYNEIGETKRLLQQQILKLMDSNK